jgi:hypothetical protein
MAPTDLEGEAGGIWHRAGFKGGSYEYGNKLSGSINSLNIH